MFTLGNIDDRKPLENKNFIAQIVRKLVGDKGYICKKLFEKLFIDGIQLVTRFKSNMKGAITSVRERAIIETVNDELKNIA